MQRDLETNIDGDPSGFIRACKAAEASAAKFEKQLNKLEAKYKRLQASQAATSKSALKMQGGMASLAAAGAAVAPAFIAAGAGVSAFGALAIPTLKGIVEAQKDMAANWSSLSGRQKVSSASLRNLLDQYRALAKSVEPDVLKTFNGALDLTAQIMPRLAPLTRATAKALQDFEVKAGRALDSSQAKDFFSFLQSEAGPAIDAMGDAAGGAAHLATSLTQALGPLAISGVRVVTMAAELLAKLSDVSPELAQLVTLSVALRGPLTGIGGFLGSVGGKFKAFSAATKGASVATKALNLASAAGPNLYLAAGVALAFFALKAANAKSATDKLVESLTVANRAAGNNVAGYQALNRALAGQLNASLAKTAEFQKAVQDSGGKVNANLYQGAQRAYEQQLAQDKLRGSMEQANRSITNITQGADALGRKYGATRSEAISLADAVGVDLSKGILDSGQITASVAAKFDRYRQAVEMARNPTAVVAQAWADAGNEALTLKDRVTAVSNAMNAFFNPALGVLSATNQMRDAMANSTKAITDQNKVLNSSKSSATERAAALRAMSSQLESNLGAIGQWVTAQGNAGKSAQLTDKAIASQLPNLLRLAGNSKVGQSAIQGLASSLGGTITRAHGAIIVTDRLGNRVKVLPNGKVVKLKADNKQANSAITATKNNLDSLRDKTVYIDTIHRDLGVTLGQPHTGVPWAPKKAAGGPITGPGTGTSDSVPIMASNGEYVVNARSVAKHRGLVEAINADRYSAGGLVGYSRGGAVSPGSALAELGKSSVAKGLSGDLQKTVSEIKTASKTLAQAVKQAYRAHRISYATAEALLSRIANGNTKLQALSKRRDALVERITAAKQYSTSVRDNARSFAALTGLNAGGNARLTSGDSRSKDDTTATPAPTAGGIRGGLQGRLAQIKRFASVVKKLGARGLSKSLLRQVIDAGPEEGLALGEALLSASKVDFKAINAAQAGINAASKSLGRSGADLLYDSGKQAGKGFLTGLTAQKKDIVKAMDGIADALVKRIRTRLKIKSPSRVTHDDARQLGAGLIRGMDSMKAPVGAAAARMAAAAIPAVAVPARSMSASGGGVANTYNITVNGALDPVGVGREIEKILVKLQRANGRTALAFT